MHVHRDPPKTGRWTAITACNANPSVPFLSEFVMVEGIVAVDNGETDVLVIDSRRYHGVGALRSPPGKQFTEQPLRHSLVHFSRPSAEPSTSAAPHALYWSVPECGLAGSRSASWKLATNL